MPNKANIMGIIAVVKPSLGAAGAALLDFNFNFNPVPAGCRIPEVCAGTEVQTQPPIHSYLFQRLYGVHI